MGKLSKTAQRALSAYGGATIWQKAQRIEAIADVSGLAFRLKFRPLFRSVRIELKVHEPVSKITPIGSQPGLSGILQGHDVWLEDATGIIADSRPAARKYFPGGRRLFYWDELDMAYFANYAFWNYLTLPALLMNPEIYWTERAPGILDVDFPRHIPTHSPRQTFFFAAETGLLKQHNYTAEVIGKWATAAHVIHGHTTQNGLAYPNRMHRLIRAPNRTQVAAGKFLNNISLPFRLIFHSHMKFGGEP